MKLIQAYKSVGEQIFYFSVTNHCHGKICYGFNEREHEWETDVFMFSDVNCEPRYFPLASYKTLKSAKKNALGFIREIAVNRRRCYEAHMHS